MKFISSHDALNFLSQAAPRPWVRRLLRWMSFDEELTAYSTKGKVQARTSAFTLTSEFYQEAQEFDGPKMDAIIRRELSPELAGKLIGKDRHSDVHDESFEWDDELNPTVVAPGFFLYTSEVDWNAGRMEIEWLERSGNLGEAIFPSEEMFETEFDDPDYSAIIEGLCFSFGDIELLVPQLELFQSSAPSPDLRKPRGAIGRPPKWDWEGAFAHVISLATSPAGLPTGQGAQARIEELMSSWFMDETGNEPAASQIRSRASRIMRTLKMPISPETA